MNPIVKSLIRKHGGKVVPFRELSKPAQAAMAWYMSVDGEAWEQAPGFRKDITNVLPWYRKEYGTERFGYVEIPTHELLDAIWDISPEMREEFGTLDGWIQWYLKYVSVPDHPSSGRWPVILSDLDIGKGIRDEGLQDGWHRLSDYIRKGAKVIPALYYPKR